MDVHAGACPVVMRLGHESGLEPMRPRSCLDRALQQQAVQRCANCVGTFFEVDLELAWTRFLHDRVDGKMLHFANAIDVVDEGRQHVHLLKAEGERPARIV